MRFFGYYLFGQVVIPEQEIIMEFKKLSAPSLKDLFVAELEGKIISGELKVGEKLPSERELADSMQVSRAVVNAGIAEMEQKGFLIIKPRVGTFVEDYRKNGTLEAFVSIMKYNGGSMTRDEVNSILQLRVVLVTLGVELAATQASDEQLTSLLNITNQLSEELTNEAVVDLTFKLYHEIAFISGNNLLPLLFVSFKDLVCRLWQKYILNFGKNALIQNNLTLTQLLISRDKDAAVNHITSSTNEAIFDERMYL